MFGVDTDTAMAATCQRLRQWLRGSSDEATKEFGDKRSLRLCNCFCTHGEKMEGGKERGRNWRISSQRRYAVSKHRTMVSGLAVVCLVLSALTDRQKGPEQERTES